VARMAARRFSARLSEAVDETQQYPTDQYGTAY
jgi:hypothetical protein